MARKRDIVARVGADTSEFDRDMRGASTTLDRFGDLGKKAGVAVAAGMVAAATAVAALTARGLELGDALDESAEALGLTVDALASLRFAASFAGVDAAELDASLAKLARTTSLAATGNEKAAETFERLGLSADEMRKLPLDEQFEEVADALGGLANDTDRARVAQDIFGRSGAQLLPLLNQGSDAIREQREEAAALGLTLDEVQRTNITEASDAIDTMKASFDGAALQLAAAFGPAIEAGARAITTLVTSITNAIPKLQALAERFFGVETAAQSLSDIALVTILHEQVDALAELDDDLAEHADTLERLRGTDAFVHFEAEHNRMLEAHAEKQARINELLAERVRRARAAEEAEASAANLGIAGVIPGEDEDAEGLANLRAEELAERERERQEEAARREQEMLNERAARKNELLGEEREAAEQRRLEELEAEEEFRRDLLLKQREFHDEQVRMEEEALQRKRQIRKDTVDNAFAGFTQITAALAAHNQKAFKLNKVAAKAEASLNAFRAIQQVWADNTLPFYAKIAATAITAAATAANIAGINKAEFGGGTVPSNAGATPVVAGGAGLTGTAGPGAGRSTTVFVEGLSPDAIFSGSAVRGLLERLNDAIKDGGKLVVQ